MSNMMRGVADLLRMINLNTIYSWMGILKDSAMSGFRFLTLNVRTIAFLDPKGFAKDKTIRVPAMVMQVMDRNQECELLPSHCFERKMKIQKGQLIVELGKGDSIAFPISPIKGADGERIITKDGKKLYAINTNQQDKAFDVLWLNPISKYKNKRMVIACDGDKIIPTRKNDDRRVMKAVYNAEVSPETRRIVNKRTGQTIWSATLLIAMPGNIIAGMLNIVCLIPHALLNGFRKLFDGIAGMCENKARHLAVARSRETAIGGRFTSPWLFLVMGAAFRLVERAISLCSSIVGCVRATVVNSVMLIPVAANAGINSCPAQYEVAKQCVFSTVREVGNEVKQYAADGIDGLRFYLLNIRRAMNSRPVVREEGKQLPSSVAGSKGRDLTRGNEVGSEQRSRSSDYGRGMTGTVTSPVTIDRIDMRHVKKAGDSLSHSGATVAYGTKQQVSYGVRVSDNSAQQKVPGRG